MKEVNLEQILLVCVAKQVVEFDETNEAHVQIGKELLEKVKQTENFKVIIEAMKNACEQTVDLCTENAEAYFIFNQRIYHDGAHIEKQSILNTKNQIK